MYTSAPSGGGAAKSRFGNWLAMPGLVPGIHALAASNRRGWPDEARHDDNQIIEDR
jgi:hypothetical protein